MAEGYDTNRFHSTIEEGFICSICLGVLQDPMQCESNEHYFCSGCIKKHLEKTSHSCPVCQDKLSVETLRKAPRIVADCVSHYKISCDHATRGCDAVLELGALQAHVQECDFMPVSCSNESCDEVVSKRDIKQHEIELCRFKTTTCDECGKKMPQQKYGAHGCVLRRDLNDVKKDVAEMKVTQHEMMNEMREGMQRITIAIEKLEKSSRTVTNAVNSMYSNIVVIGGIDPATEETLSSVERFNFLNQTWVPLSELKIGRIAYAAMVFENQILVCGGYIGDSSSGTLSVDWNGGDATDSIEALDLNVNPSTWQEFAVNLPIKVASHKCVVYGNRLLIIGGQTKDHESLDTIYELLLVPPYSSKLLCHMKKKRISHGVELFDHKVLIAGGSETGTDVEMYDITRNECVEMPPLPSPIYAMATVRRNDTMLLIGGIRSDESDESGELEESDESDDDISDEIIEYDIKSGQSKVLVAMKAKRVCPAVCIGNTLVVISGTEDDPCSVDCFNFLSNSWKKLPSVAQARVFASAVVVNNFEY